VDGYIIFSDILIFIIYRKQSKPSHLRIDRKKDFGFSPGSNLLPSIKDYGKHPDPQKVRSDYRKYIMLLAFCSTLATTGTSLLIYSAFTLA